MINVYKLDNQGIFSGSVRCDAMGPLPVPCVLIAPPALTESECAKWNGDSWVILDSYPELQLNRIQPPQQVSMRQARLALLDAGLLDDVESVISAAGRAAQIEWEYAATVDRNHPVIAIVQQQQGMTGSQIDALFTSAAAL